MRLASAHQLSLVESTFIDPYPILEDGEAPRWAFQYDNYRHDPAPDILVLGAYRHPNTGNNLIGGVNINYLDRTQREDLARVLPQLMQATNLYQRYHLGKRLLPGVFDNYYRTYNASHIRGVNQSVFHPRYGMLQATRDFLKKKIGGLLKTKQQRAADAQPKFPGDLEGMKDSLDQTIQQLGLQVGQGQQDQDTPEVQAALKNMQQFRAQQSMDQIEQDEDDAFIQASNNFQATQLQHGQATPQQVSPQVSNQVIQHQSTPTTAPTPATPQQLGRAFEKERIENQRELADPRNNLDLDRDGQPDRLQSEAMKLSTITYYNPVVGGYVVEPLLLEWEQPSQQWEDNDPDTIWKRDQEAVAFIYTADRDLYTNPDGGTHTGLIDQEEGLFNRYFKLLQTDSVARMWDYGQDYDLFGRVGRGGDGQRLVSFWNSAKGIYDKLLMPCLSELISSGLAKDTDYVATPTLGVVMINSLTGSSGLNHQQVDQEKMELYKQLHLMRGQDKREAMKKLGLGAGGKGKWQAAHEKAGVVNPGQRWWAPTSEETLREPLC